MTRTDRPRPVRVDDTTVDLTCSGATMTLMHDERGDLALALLQATTDDLRNVMATWLDKEIVDAENRAATDNQILANAVDLDDDDHSTLADGVRETAGDIRDHRSDRNQSGAHRRRMAEARKDLPRPTVAVQGDRVEIALDGVTAEELTRAGAGALAAELLRASGVRDRVRVGRRLRQPATA